MEGLPAPPSQHNKKPLHSLLSSTTVFLLLTVIPFISSNQSIKKFSFSYFYCRFLRGQEQLLHTLTARDRVGNESKGKKKKISF